jgi:hypothetical protein
MLLACLLFVNYCAVAACGGLDFAALGGILRCYAKNGQANCVTYAQTTQDVHLTT